MSLDVERVGALLHIVEMSAGHGAKLSAIMKEASDELNVLNDELRKDHLAAARAPAAEAPTPPLENEHDISNDPNVQRDADRSVPRRA